MFSNAEHKVPKNNKKSTKKLKEMDEKQTTVPQLQDAILQNLINWGEGEPMHHPQEGHQ
jgi:hypothetical protein